MRKVFSPSVVNITVIVAALGYFVDMFDITIFGVVRVASLKAIGITDPTELFNKGMWLVNLQAWGMLIGGLLWGVLGDKRGRLSILFGSIVLYSVANILNGFVTTFEQYAVLRFFAGVGLAGELGAAVTLVSEVMTKESRGYGTTIVAAMGLLGSVTAALVGQILPWNVVYWIGGSMGLLLLAARLKMAESGMFSDAKKTAHKGDLRLLVTGGRLSKYIYCILVGVPIYFITGILLTFAPELTRELGIEGITAGNALLYGSIGLTIGDLLSGLCSQLMKSRKRAISLFMGIGAISAFLYFRSFGISPTTFYVLCFVMGAAAGLWAVLVTMTAEQFGTNIRATAATSVPNFVRSSVIVMTSSFVALKAHFTILHSALIIGVVVFSAAFFALMRLPETFGKDLDYSEEFGESTVPVASAAKART